MNVKADYIENEKKDVTTTRILLMIINESPKIASQNETSVRNKP